MKDILGTLLCITIGDQESFTRPLPPVAIQTKLALPPRGTRSTIGEMTTDIGSNTGGGVVVAAII